jgi:hypothetical protein
LQFPTAEALKPVLTAVAGLLAASGDEAIEIRP